MAIKLVICVHVIVDDGYEYGFSMAMIMITDDDDDDDLIISFGIPLGFFMYVCFTYGYLNRIKVACFFACSLHLHVLEYNGVTKIFFSIYFSLDSGM